MATDLIILLTCIYESVVSKSTNAARISILDIRISNAAPVHYALPCSTQQHLFMLLVVSEDERNNAIYLADYISYAPEVVSYLHAATDVRVTYVYSFRCHCLSLLASLCCTLVLLFRVTVFLLL
jgi:hypothetical protein